MDSSRTHTENVIFGIFLGLVTIITVGGNLLVILAVALVKKLRTASNFLIVSLALSDLLVGILVIPIASVREIVQAWTMGETLCDIYISFDVLLCTASILNLCAISIDRYLAITKPLQYAAKRTPKRMFLMIAGVWVASALISITPLFGFKEPYREGECGYSDNIIYQIYATCGAFYIPLIVMLVLYGRIFILARRMAFEDAKQKRVTESVAYQTDVKQSYNPLDQSSAMNYQMLPTKMSTTDLNISKGFGKRCHTNLCGKFEKRTSDLLAKRYPLPPSELCRRRKPRLMQRQQSFTSVSEAAKKQAPEINPDLTRSQLSCTEEFEERIKNLRKLREEFFAAPPSRHCSSIILNLRPRGSSLTEPLIDVQNDNISGAFNPPVFRFPSESYRCHLHTSHSMRVDYYKAKDIEGDEVNEGFSKQPLPTLSISEYQDDKIVRSDHSINSTVVHDITAQSVDDAGLFIPSSQGPFSGVPNIGPKVPRPKQRPLHTGRRSYSNAADRFRKDSATRIGSLGLPKYTLDRRQSSPAPTGNWRSPINGKKSPLSEKFVGRSPGRNSDAGFVEVRSRNPSWASIKVQMRKRKSKGHSDSKAIKTLGVIMGCFCLCWIPFFIIALARPLHKVVTKQDLIIRTEIESLFLWLGYINSTINPIIYAIFNREFRIPFKEILICRCRGINARLRSQRYAAEIGYAAASTASGMGLVNPPTALGDNGISPPGNEEVNISTKPLYRPYQPRSKADSVANHVLQAQRMTVQSLEVPVGTLGRRASMSLNRRF